MLVLKSLHHQIISGQKPLAVLIDPDKMNLAQLPTFLQQIHQSVATHIFLGGSTDEASKTDGLAKAIKSQSQLPLVLFPGDVSQLTTHADALLFLSLISGDNPEYLIKKQVEAVSKLKHSKIEVIPTGYILIENGKVTSVEKVTGTKPMSRHNIQLIVDTAKAGELLGMKLIYLEAGSGAVHPISEAIIKAVKSELKIPVIVGGGIKTKNQLDAAYNAGADMVVIGTAFEENETFIDELKAP
jgi:putative glycerol-1-phosphate prenyltransferase